MQTRPLPPFALVTTLVAALLVGTCSVAGAAATVVAQPAPSTSAQPPDPTTLSPGALPADTPAEIVAPVPPSALKASDVNVPRPRRTLRVRRATNQVQPGKGAAGLPDADRSATRQAP